MRLIDADALAVELLSLTWLGCDGGYYKGMADERDATLQRIASAPTIEPVNRARWDGKCGATCSWCGYIDPEEYIERHPNFCPDCGADMRTEDA